MARLGILVIQAEVAQTHELESGGRLAGLVAFGVAISLSGAFEAQLAPERAGASATSPLNPFLDSIKELEQ